MLTGIIKPKGEIVSFQGMEAGLGTSAIRCYEAGFLYGVNENGGMIRFDSQIKSDIFVKDAAQPAKPEPAAEQPEQPVEQPEQPAEQPEQPAEPAAEPGRSGGTGNGSK